MLIPTRLNKLSISASSCFPSLCVINIHLAPSVGAGISGAASWAYLKGPNGNKIEITSALGTIFSYNVQAGIGYRYKNWRFQSGIQYFKSGYDANLIFSSDFDPTQIITKGSGSQQFSFSHIGIPLQLGYAIPLSRKLNLIPNIGALTAFTVSGSSKLEYPGHISKHSFSSDELNHYGRFKVWAYAGAQLEYKINNRASLFGGPSVQYMLGNQGNLLARNYYNANFNLGLNLNL